MGKLHTYAADEARPSNWEHDPWLYCGDAARAQSPADERGSWLLFCPTETVDTDWLIISTATSNGSLGLSAKVSTACAAHANTHETRLICVQADTALAERDRVLGKLRELGWRLDVQFKLHAASLGTNFATPPIIWARGEAGALEWHS